jgi:hypothetical protein
MYSVIIFIFTHVTKLHFSVFIKTREKTREKQKKNKRKTRTDNVNHNHRFTDLQMSIVKALTIDHAQSEVVQVV